MSVYSWWKSVFDQWNLVGSKYLLSHVFHCLMPPVPLEPCSHTTSPSSRWSSSWVALVPFVRQNFVKSLLVQRFPSYIGATCKMPRVSCVLLSHFICQHLCTFSFTLLTRKSETIFRQIHRVYVLRQYCSLLHFPWLGAAAMQNLIRKYGLCTLHWLGR